MCDGGRGEAPRGVKKRGHCKTIAAAGKGRARVGRAVLVALALAGGGIAPLRAQELAATPYRPTVSDPAALPVPRHLEVEAGGTFEGQSADKRVVTPVLLKYAFNPDVGVLIGTDGFVWQRQGGVESAGRGDVSTTLKLRLPGRHGDFGLEAGTLLPTSTADLGNRKADYALIGIYSTDAGALHADVNLGVVRHGETDAAGRHEYTLAAAVSHPLRGRLSVAVELSGATRRAAATASQFLGALTYALTPRVVIDTGATAGLARGSPDWPAFAGVTVLF